MTVELPAYLSVPPERLGAGTPIKVHGCGNPADVARHMTQAMFRVIHATRAAGRAATLIVPVGPIDQFPVLAQLINEQHMNCRDVVLINMDEYLTDDDRWIDRDHPLSFRGFMARKFYDLLHPNLAPR